ncbi:hypothetical protein GCM10009554_42620 [Kribbella koreensis]|uniref:Uncharacterized protein n=2 Tax=Kribbella TaxID=182639 RepID=A0ABP6VPQ4_9ACTN
MPGPGDVADGDFGGVEGAVGHWADGFWGESAVLEFLGHCVGEGEVAFITPSDGLQPVPCGSTILSRLSGTACRSDVSPIALEPPVLRVTAQAPVQI